jgi:hypothetical protein
MQTVELGALHDVGEAMGLHDPDAFKGPGPVEGHARTDPLEVGP